MKIFLFCFLIFNQSFAAVTLKESFNSALKVNQANNINNAKIEQAESLKTQGRSSYYPKLYIKGNYTKQENYADTKYWNLYLSHSLFKGGKDWITTEIAANTKSIYELNKEADQLNLYQNVINAFYNYFLYENDAKNLDLLTKQSTDRVNEISKRVSIGRSRFGELLQAKAQLASATASYENAKGLAVEAREKFKILTGIIDDTPDVKLDEKLNHYNLNDLLVKAYERSDVKSKELKIDEAHLNLNLNKASHLPTLDLTANYYLNKRNTTTYAKTDWDTGLVLTIPLFEGFNTDSKIDESIAKEHEAKYNYLDLKKSIEIDLAAKLETHNRYVDQIATFDEAMNLAKKSYDEALKDYRLGLISNLDVLTALNLYLDTKRNTEKNKIQAIMSEKLLEATIGALP